MPAFLVTATVSDIYLQTVDARDEREATAIAQHRPDSWRMGHGESLRFEAQQVLLP